MRKIGLFISVVVLLLGISITSAQEDSSNVSVTVYNQGTALIRDQRTFDLQAGENIVNFTDVASSIDATSVSFSSLTDPEGTIVMEQNYVYDLVNSSALLARYLDQTIEVTLEDGTVFTGQLLSGRNNEVILRDGDGQISVVNLDKIRDIRFPELPDGLITRPTLKWLIYSPQTGPQDVELTYLTSGMNWSADYILLLANDKQSLDLNGWITLNNTSGATYKNALLKLVAGDVNRLPEYDSRAMMADAEIMYEAAAAPAPVEQREFFEYQLYEIPRPVTVADNETKQVEFVTGANVPATTFYVYDGSPGFYGYYGYAVTDQYYGQTGITDVQNWLEFSTDEDGGVGADLPAGSVRVYQEDVDGAALLIGENSIDHTPEGEDVQIYLGNAFDLVGERSQTDFQLISRTVLRETYEIKLRNRKDNEPVEIRVPEHLFRWSNWEILFNSHEYTKLDSGTIEFRVTVPPGEETTITYTVQYSWPG
jgi:hypothetical protein